MIRPCAITSGSNKMAALNEYELQREARIAENRRRMEELGLIKVDVLCAACSLVLSLSKLLNNKAPAL